MTNYLLLMLSSATVAACTYDARFNDCAVHCATDQTCPDDLSCSVGEGFCRTGTSSQLCASIIADSGAADGPDTTSALVGWWKLDEGNGNQVTDASGNGNTGALQNGPVWITGISGMALSFNGSGQFVRVADSPELRAGTNILTLAAWVKRGTPNATGGIVQKCTTGSGWTLSIGVTPCMENQIKATKYGVTDICLGAVPVDTNWHHLALVFSATGVNAYIDGWLDATHTDTQNFQSNVDVLTIGVSLCNNSYFNGAVDDVRVYKRSLSAADILEIAR